MRQAAALLLVLLSVSAVRTASADETAFVCNYQLGLEASATRRKVGSVTIAIDLDAKTARIDFGRGWFRTMSFRVDGNDIKETGSPASGDQLGAFYFDLSEHTGGFAGKSAPHEFFDGCVPTKIEAAADELGPGAVAPVVTPVPQAKAPKPADGPAATAEGAPPASPSRESAAATPSGNSTPPPAWKPDTPASANPKTKAAGPAVAPPAMIEPVPPSPSKQASTDLHDKKPAESPTSSPEPQNNPAPETMNPAPEIKPDRAEATPVVREAPAPSAPMAGGQGTTEYYGQKESAKPPTSNVQVAINPPSEPQAVAPTGPSQVNLPESTPTDEGRSRERCRNELDAKAQDMKLIFANASVVIDRESQNQLKEIAETLKRCEEVIVEVGGHTDNLGDPKQNKKLSQGRANAVADILVAQGVKPSNLKSVGYGQEKPIESNTTREGRRLNRRVEFHILDN